MEEEEEVDAEDEKAWSKEVKKRIAELRYGWKKGEKTVDERAMASGQIRKHRARLTMDALDTKTLLDYFLHFHPLAYDIEKVIPAINATGRAKHGDAWRDIDIGDYLRYLGIRLYQEVEQLPSIKWYWEIISDGIFPAWNLGRFMPRLQFENITDSISLSESPDDEEQILTYINVLNSSFQDALVPSSTIVLDESMIKAYHYGMIAKKKIIRKPRPIGVELKNLADGETCIVLNIEKHGTKETMAQTEFTNELGSTTAVSLRLTKPYWATGRLVLGDAWFGSVKCCNELLKRGLFSIMVVKNNHKLFPTSCLTTNVTNGDGEIIGEELIDHELDDIVNGTFSRFSVARGDWVTYICGNLFAVRFTDLKDKYLICSAGTTLAGESRITRSGKVISRPSVSAECSKSIDAIDRSNHFRTGGTGLEDSWQTNSPKLRQYAALIGFVETNAYLAYKNFSGNDMLHRDFRRELVKVLIHNPFRTYSVNRRSEALSIAVPVAKPQHTVMKLSNDGRQQRRCFYCCNAYNSRFDNKTSYYCAHPSCGKDRPLCATPLTTGRDCFKLHVANGMPEKQYRK